MSADYSAHADRCLKSMQDYPTFFTTAGDVAEAVYAAATDAGNVLRYPAGADSVITIVRLTKSARTD